MFEVLKSENPRFGFFGTVSIHAPQQAEELWRSAFAWVAKEKPTWTMRKIRNFLDSVTGRHLADAFLCIGSLEKLDRSKWKQFFFHFESQNSSPLFETAAQKYNAIFSRIAAAGATLRKAKHDAASFVGEFQLVREPAIRELVRDVERALTELTEADTAINR